MYSLYVKTHNVTGLKYLGQTRKNPFTYLGSGDYWTRHLSTHGNDVRTEVIFETSDPIELREKGLYYSRFWNVVYAKDDTGKKIWANLKEEEGQGGSMSAESMQKRSKHLHPSKIRVSCLQCKKTIGFTNFVRSHGEKCGIKIGSKPGNLNTRFDPAIYTFYNLNTGEVVKSTQYDFYNSGRITKSAVNQLVKKRCFEQSGWSLHPSRPELLKYTFIHVDGREMISTQRKFSEMHNVRYSIVGELIHKKRKSIKGWSLPDHL